MKRMHFRYTLLALTIALTMLIAACGGATPAPPAQSSAQPFRIAVVMPSAVTDMAFSQSMWEALKAVQAEMGGEEALKLAYSENMFRVPDAAAALRDYASEGYDIVIAHGSQYGATIQEVAPDFPETSFAWGTNVDTFGLPNVYAYTAAAEEGGYVNGVVAALLTKSNIIGVTGPVEVGDAKTYIDGFRNGVMATNPSAQVNATWTGSFSDVALMTEAANTHIAAGADILTGSSQSVIGSIGAAKDKGNVLWFGTQSDQAALAPDQVVASQVYDWTGIVREMISQHRAGVLGGESFVLHLSNGGLRMAYSTGYSLPADAQAAAEAAIEGIKSGSIKPLP
jgi:basic membrane lipoprotein Med (substrate-binding protein (PBP1-ABC) superfamily)